jgi:hypothetical protein
MAQWSYGNNQYKSEYITITVCSAPISEHTDVNSIQSRGFGDITICSYTSPTIIDQLYDATPHKHREFYNVTGDCAQLVTPA